MEKTTEKKYIRKTFVVDKDTISKLQKIANENDRSLNWIVKNALSEYADKNSIDET